MVPFTELIKQVCDEDEYIESYLVGPSKKFEDRKSPSLERNKKVRRIWELLRYNENVVTVNKSPTKLQFRENVEEKPILFG